MHDLIQALLFAYYIDFSCVYNKTVTHFFKEMQQFITKEGKSMKIFKKIIAAVAAAAVALSALPASAFVAEDWMAKAKVIQPDKEYSFTLPDNTSETVEYKLDMKFPGYLVLDVSSTADETHFNWWSETSDYSYFHNYESTKGSAGYYYYYYLTSYYSYLNGIPMRKRVTAHFLGNCLRVHITSDSSAAVIMVPER